MNIEPIGIIKSPFKQKFAIPRQPGLVKQAIGEIHFDARFSDAMCLRDIEQFSHLWLLFEFHQTADKGWSPLVRPPRLGGNQKVGVFATRSTFRPNAIGMSVVELIDHRLNKGQLVLRVRGIDLLDDTPILDIKPYIPYSDALPQAQGGFANSAPTSLQQVQFSEQAQQQLADIQQQHPKIHADLGEFIHDVLAQDPRPAYKQKQNAVQEYGMSLYDFNIRWQVDQQQSLVLSIVQE
ncbi:tRNA (N6-threonylcarbamoyladenosine(37)-N6)-methyltransferase TrmO [Alteromonadaceae bacterium BrNp21-10]|nr:tRNA (N6-threonylcarbamoyladenosine(37)-N6)-methyltransferase TrmO [Alteromonadaceae bacterium BrNp21-10]